MSYPTNNGQSGSYFDLVRPPEDEPGYNTPQQADYNTPQHPRGRAVPPVAAPDEPHFDIAVDGVRLGTVYPMRLTGRAQFDLERSATLLSILAWMVKYAGADAAQIEHVLAERPIYEIANFISGITQALTQSIALGNGSGPR